MRHQLNSEVIFIDESGDPALSEKSIERMPYYAMGFVYCNGVCVLQKSLTAFNGVSRQEL